MPPDRSGVKRNHEKSSTSVTLCFCLRHLSITDTITPSKKGSPAFCGIAATLTRLSVLTKKSLSSQKEMHPVTHLGIVTDGPAHHSKDPLYLKSCPHLPPQTSIVSELQ